MSDTFFQNPNHTFNRIKLSTNFTYNKKFSPFYLFLKTFNLTLKNKVLLDMAKNESDYLNDLAEIRSMMERSSKFLSLSGWAGILAGLYALAGAYIASTFLNFNPQSIYLKSLSNDFSSIFLLGVLVLAAALITAVLLSKNKASKKGENIWNATSKRMLSSMAVPLLAGGVLLLIVISKSIIGLILPLSLIFYGLALYNASKFTFSEVKFLGFVQLCLGLLSSYFIEYSLLIWALGFGLVHIIYGIYIYFKYEQ